MSLHYGISTWNAGVLWLELDRAWCSENSSRISKNFTFRRLGQFVLKLHMVLNLFPFNWLSHLVLWRWKTQLRNHCVAVTTGLFILLSMEGEKRLSRTKCAIAVSLDLSLLTQLIQRLFLSLFFFFKAENIKGIKWPSCYLLSIVAVEGEVAILWVFGKWLIYLLSP